MNSHKKNDSKIDNLGIYLGNLPNETEESDVLTLIKNFQGTKFLRLKKNDRKVFCFLRCDNEAEVLQVVRALQGTNIKGRKLCARALDSQLQSKCEKLQKPDENNSGNLTHDLTNQKASKSYNNCTLKTTEGCKSNFHKQDDITIDDKKLSQTSYKNNETDTSLNHSETSSSTLNRDILPIISGMKTMTLREQNELQQSDSFSSKTEKMPLGRAANLKIQKAACNKPAPVFCPKYDGNSPPPLVPIKSEEVKKKNEIAYSNLKYEEFVRNGPPPLKLAEVPESDIRPAIPPSSRYTETSKANREIETNHFNMIPPSMKKNYTSHSNSHVKFIGPMYPKNGSAAHQESVYESRPVYHKNKSNFKMQNSGYNKKPCITEFNHDVHTRVSNYSSQPNFNRSSLPPQEDENDLAVVLCVSNFPFHTTEDEIFDLFEEFDPLEVNLVCNSYRKGQCTEAYVVLPSEDFAVEAIMQLDNTVYGNRTLLVTDVREDDSLQDLLIMHENQIDDYSE